MATPGSGLRVLLANHTPVAGSGSGTYTAMLARGLVRAGHRACVLTPQADEFPVGGGVECHRAEGLPRAFPSFTGHPLSAVTYDRLDEGELGRLLDVWQAAFDAVRRAWQPDVVHVQHLWVLARGAQLAGLRPVVTCHGSELAFAAAWPGVAARLQPVPGEVAALICISGYVAGRAAALAEQVPARHTLANPYDDALFFLRPGLAETAGPGPRLGFVGRLVAYKGCDRFLRCVARLRPQVPGLTASVVGGGPERRRLHDLARELDLLDLVEFVGQVEQAALADHYQRFDVLVVPSRHEPFGLVALEAVACGTPAVVARSGGLAGLVHSPFVVGYEPAAVEGTVAVEDTAEAVTTNGPDGGDLERVVLGVLGRGRSGELARCGAAWVREQYSLEHYVQQLETIYQQVGETGACGGQRT